MQRTVNGARPAPGNRGARGAPERAKIDFVKPDGYKWDGDSRDERESEFSETFPTTRGGTFPATRAQDAARRESQRRRRISGIVWAALVAIGIGAPLDWGVVHRLRG